MDLRKLKTLIDLVSESNVSELEITEADGKVRIVKQGAVAMPTGNSIGSLRMNCRTALGWSTARPIRRQPRAA